MQNLMISNQLTDHLYKSNYINRPITYYSILQFVWANVNHILMLTYAVMQTWNI